MTKQLLINLCKYGLGLGILAYVIWRNWSPAGGSPGLADALQRPIQLVPLLLACTICTVGVVLTFIRWYILVRAQELPFTLGDALRLGSIGFFLNTCLPGSVGGDIIKAAFIAREQKRRTVAVATVLLDRIIGLWGLFWLVVLLGLAFWMEGNAALHANRGLQTILLGCVAVVVASVVCWVLLGILSDSRAQRLASSLERVPKVGHSLAELWRACWMYRRRGQSVAAALLISVIGHVCFVLAYYFAAQIFQEPGQEGQIPTLAEQFLIIPVGMTFQAVFPSPGGVGAGEWGFGKLYALVGKPEAEGVLASLAQRAVNWLLGFVGYLVYLRMRPTLRGVTEEPVEGTEAAGD